MRLPVVFMLLSTALVPACVVADSPSTSNDSCPTEAINIQEGQVLVPAVTKDNNYPMVTVDYAFAVESDGLSRSQSQMQRDVTELQQVNMDGIIAHRIRAYLLDRMAELTYEALASMVDENPSNNQLTNELEERLGADEGLKNVRIHSISLNHE